MEFIVRGIDTGLWRNRDAEKLPIFCVGGEPQLGVQWFEFRKKRNQKYRLIHLIIAGELIALKALKNARKTLNSRKISLKSQKFYELL